jgi:hypothetical protein
VKARPARLIVHKDSKWVLPVYGDIGPSLTPSKEHPCLYPTDRPIPEGWEEIEVVKPGLRSERPGAFDAGLELCSCGHDRRSHIQHNQRCLVRRDAVNCACLRFEEAG